MSRTVEFLDKQAAKGFSAEVIPQQRSATLRFFKRLVDLLGAVFGLVIFSPFFLYITIRIKRESPGPVYYRGERVGRNGKLFKILKFRTMYETPQNHNGLPLTVKNDERVTLFGAWLRETKLNELPNFWNVLIGEMSLVGPRPEDPAFVKEWPEDVKTEVLSVRPGMTSPASVIFRDEENLLRGSSVLDDYLKSILPEKLRLDQLYVRYYNFLGDLDVIFMTMVMLIPGLRQRKVQEGTLFEGPLVRFSRAYISWFIADTIIAFLAISIATLLWRIQIPLDVGFGRMVLLAAGLAFILGFTNTLLGLRNISWRYANPTHVFDIALSTSLALVVFALLSPPLLSIRLPINLLINIGLLSFAGFVAARYRERLLTGLASRWVRWRGQSSLIGERVLIVGAGDAGQLAIWLLEKSNHYSAFSIVGLVDDDFRKVKKNITGYPVLGTTRDIPALVKKKSIGLILFAITRVSDKERDRILNACKELPVRVVLIPDLLKLVNEYLSQQTREVVDNDV